MFVFYLAQSRRLAENALVIKEKACTSAWFVETRYFLPTLNSIAKAAGLVFGKPQIRMRLKLWMIGVWECTEPKLVVRIVELT